MKLAPNKFFIGLLTTAALAVAAPSQAQEAGVQLGELACDVSGGDGFIFGSSKNLTCTFTPANDQLPQEQYTGKIDKYGIDIGYTRNSVIAWAVVAAEADKYQPGALAGTYGGATAGASIAVGLGANALVGGSGNSIALQPISIEASRGLNLAVGLAQLTLNPS